MRTGTREVASWQLSSPCPTAAREERELRERAREMLASLHIEEYAARYPSSLPYAVRKKVALARALVAEPDLLLLDEPASGLSSDEMDELGALIRDLTSRMSVMLVEHHMDLVMTVCDDIVVLDFGRVIARGGPDQIRDDPAVLAAYLGDAVSHGRHDGRTEMLELQGLSTTYGAVRALDDVTFTAPRGEITAVLGANGAGKTTLLRTVSGLVRPSAGSVRFDGRDLTRTAAERMPGLGLAHVPEGRGVITELTVEENLRLGGLGRGGRVKTEDLERVYGLFPFLADRRSAVADVLSGGERQMLVIGRALMASPTMLLLDEPSLGLAPRIVAQIFDLLLTLVENEGLTVLLVEQNARSALSIAHQGVVLNLGRLVVHDEAAVLAADDQLRHAYLGF